MELQVCTGSGTCTNHVDPDYYCLNCGDFFCARHRPRVWPGSNPERSLCQHCNLRLPSDPPPEKTPVQLILEDSWADEKAYTHRLHASIPSEHELKAREFYLLRRKRLLSMKALAGMVGGTHAESDRRVSYLHLRNDVRNAKLLRKQVVGADTCDKSLKPKVSISVSDFDDLISPSDTPKPSRNIPENIYTFSGMHHVFSDPSGACLTNVRFANHRSDLLAFSSMSGLLTVASVLPQPKVLFELKGHGGGITDLDWSIANDYLLSASLDMSVRIWDPATGQCLRIVYDEDGSAVFSVRLHPINNNMFIMSNSMGRVRIYNLSTGMSLQKFELKNPIRTMTFDALGTILFFGDSRGCLHTYDAKKTRYVSRLKTTVCPGKAITHMSYSSGLAGVAGPLLLLNCGDSTVRLINLSGVLRGKVEQLRCFVNPSAALAIRSSFCPTLSLRIGSYVVTGSEDMGVHFFDVARKDGNGKVNTLMGHSAGVIDVNWSCDGSLLASCDALGTVIVWKRDTSNDRTSQSRRSRGGPLLNPHHVNPAYRPSSGGTSASASRPAGLGFGQSAGHAKRHSADETFLRTAVTDFT